MIIITGASKGIGKYLFDSFLSNSNESVIGTYLTSKPTKHLKLLYQVDVTDYNYVKNFVDNISTILDDSQMK